LFPAVRGAKALGHLGAVKRPARLRTFVWTQRPALAASLLGIARATRLPL